MSEANFGVAGRILRVVARPDVMGLTRRLLGTALCSAAPSAAAEWTLHVVPAGDVLAPELCHRASRPLLSLGHTRWSLVEWTADAMMVVAHNGDDERVVIATDRARRETIAAVADTDNGRRWPSRLAKLFLGGRLLHDGWIPVHASCVVADGGMVLFCGGRGAGKSTIAYVATTDFGAAFGSDDTTLLKRDGDRLRAFGWPKRIGLPRSALRERHAVLVPKLRRMPLNATETREVRIVFDPDEHRDLLGIEHQGVGEVRAMVMLQASDDGKMRVERTVDPMAHRALWATDLVHRRYMIDVLGVFAPPGDPLLPAGDGALARLFDGVMCSLAYTAVPVHRYAAELWKGVVGDLG